MQLTTGVRKDDFQWSIAGDTTGNSPNVISELTWTDLVSAPIKVKGNITLANHWVLDGMASYGDLFDGDNQDSDYAGDNKTLEFQRSTASTQGNIVDFSGGVGYRIYLGSEKEYLRADHLWFTLLTGYSYHELDLNDTNGILIIPTTGGFPGLDSTYEAEWEGPWYGFELSGNRGRLTGLLRLEYHEADYYGKANWNLRPDFQHPKSFEQITKGRGVLWNLGGAYQVSDSWDLNFNADFQNWDAWEGIVRFFLATGATPEQQFNRAKWDSYAMMLGARYSFY